MDQLSTQANPGPKYQHFAIVAVCITLVAFFMAVVQYKVPTIMISLMGVYDMDAAAGSWLMSIFTLVMVFFAIPSGALSQRIGPRKVAVVAVGVMVCGCVVGAFAPNATVLLVSRAIEGVALTAMTTCGPVLVETSVAPEKLGGALGIWGVWGSAASAFAALITPTLFVLVVMTLIIVFGGIQRIAKVSSVLVPVMAVGYFVLALVVIVMNIGLAPHVFKVIIESAFGLDQAVGGTLGAAIMNGVKRGLFSNEAGEGSAPNAAATAAVSHPVKQGLIQALGVFTDTLVVCSCTAFIILISGLYTSPELNGIMLTQAALESEVGSWGPTFIAIAIFLFAYSSMIGNYYYGEANVRFMTQSKGAMTTYRLLSGGAMVLFGAWTTLEVVWSVIDLCMALLTACNLVAIALLGKYVFRLLDDYCSQKRQGIKEPTFQRSKLPEIAEDIECWE